MVIGLISMILFRSLELYPYLRQITKTKDKYLYYTNKKNVARDPSIVPK
jgi:hypothetical protein